MALTHPFFQDRCPAPHLRPNFQRRHHNPEAGSALSQPSSTPGGAVLDDSDPLRTAAPAPLSRASVVRGADGEEQVGRVGLVDVVERRCAAWG